MADVLLLTYIEFNAGMKLNNICEDVNFGKVIFNIKTHMLTFNFFIIIG